METLCWKHNETWYILPALAVEIETLWNGRTDLIIGLKWLNRSWAVVITINKNLL